MNTRSRTRSGGAPPPAPIAIKKKTSTNAGARSKAKAAAVDKAAAPAASAAATATSASASAADKAKTVAVSEDAVAASKAAAPASDAATKKAEAAAAKKTETAAKKADAAAAKKAEAAAKKADSAATKKAEKKAPVEAATAADIEAASSAAAGKKSGLSVGDDFPAMKLLADDGKEVDLGAVLKEQGLVLFMYPKANTPGCTKQACGFRENTVELASAGFAVYGMSADTPAAQTSWKTKHSLAYPLLCDRDLALVKAIGAFKAPKNIKRSHIVVAKGGKVLDVRVMIGPEDSFKEAVNFVKGLDKGE